jgi:hypothetical protein
VVALFTHWLPGLYKIRCSNSGWNTITIWKNILLGRASFTNKAMGDNFPTSNYDVLADHFFFVRFTPTYHKFFNSLVSNSNAITRRYLKTIYLIFCFALSSFADNFSTVYGHSDDFYWIVNILKFLVMYFCRRRFPSSLLGLNIFLSTLSSNNLNGYYSFRARYKILHPYKTAG